MKKLICVFLALSLFAPAVITASAIAAVDNSATDKVAATETAAKAATDKAAATETADKTAADNSTTDKTAVETAVDKTTAKAAETAKASCGEEYGLISAISDAGKYIDISSEKSVTREEFVSALVSVLEINALSSGDTEFSDVAAGSELYKALMQAASAGIISPGGAFRPDDEVTYEEMAKMCTSALGYGAACEASGGYPSGYTKRAAELEIFKGTSGKAMPKDIYVILYNTVCAPIMSVKQSGGKMEYGESGESFLSKYKNITKIKGNVTSNEYTELGVSTENARGAAELSGTIGIDGRTYVSGGSFNGYIGYNVSAYVKSDRQSGEETVVFVYPAKSKSAVLSGDDLEYEGGTLTDYSGGKTKKYKINKSCDIIVNGKADYSYKLTDIDKLIGSVTLVGSGGAAEYDVVIIESYKYMRVETYDKRNLILRDIDSADNTVRLDESGVCSVYIDEEDAEGNLGSLEAGSYIAIAASADFEVCRIVTLGKLAEGIVTKIGEDKMTVGEKEYDLSDFFKDGDLKRVATGKSYGFYLGIKGEIVAINYLNSGFIYAYLIKAYRSEDDENDVTLKIFTQRGEIEKYSLSDKVRLDGASGRKPGSVYPQLSSEQLIRVQITDGKINALDTAEQKTTYTDAELDGLREDNSLTRCKFANSYYYRNNWFYPYFYTSGAVIFKIPTDTTREEDFAIGYTFDEGDSADGSLVEAYDVGINGNAGAIVAHIDTRDMDKVPRINASMIIVERVYEKLDKNGDAAVAISGWMNGKFSEYTLGSNAAVEKYYQSASLSPGDIIRASLRDNVIVSLVVEFVGSDITKNSSTGTSPSNCRSTASHFQIGSVWAMKDGGALISNTRLADGTFDYSPKNLISVKIPSNVFEFNTKTKKLTSVDQNAIKSYLNSGGEASFTVTWQVYGSSRFTIIYTDGEEN